MCAKDHGDPEFERCVRNSKIVLMSKMGPDSAARTSWSSAPLLPLDTRRFRPLRIDHFCHSTHGKTCSFS